ncbi:MAG: hypothetical protein LBM41_05640 [Ruminococcus sp.]|jgi:hypothetical protein|nr:hypothetical protein [Ruminococcus sp.]
MSGFLAARERCYNMEKRLKYYRDIGGGVTAVIPEPTFEAVHNEKNPPKNPSQKITNLFGIPLTADNCLIIALILILMKEKADMKLIIALLFLLL